MAFKRLQQIMMNLPTVQAPIHKKPLLLYMATNSYAIGALIAQEDGGGVEQPVYYISHTIKMQKLVTQGQRECVWLLCAPHRGYAIISWPTKYD